MSGVNHNCTTQKAGSPVTIFERELSLPVGSFKQGLVNPPDAAKYGNTLVNEFTVGTDTANVLFRVPDDFSSGGEVYFHWTKSQNTDQSAKNVKWQIAYNCFSSASDDVAAQGTTDSVEDTYDDNGTTTHLNYSTTGISLPGLAAGCYITMTVKAITPSGTALSEPALILVDFEYNAKTAETDL